VDVLAKMQTYVSRMLDKKRYAAEPLDNTATFLSLRS